MNASGESIANIVEQVDKPQPGEMGIFLLSSVPSHGLAAICPWIKVSLRTLDGRDCHG